MKRFKKNKKILKRLFEESIKEVESLNSKIPKDTIRELEKLSESILIPKPI